MYTWSRIYWRMCYWSEVDIGLTRGSQTQLLLWYYYMLLWQCHNSVIMGNKGYLIALITLLWHYYDTIMTLLWHYYCFHYDTVDYYDTIMTLLLFPLYHYYDTIILIIFFIISLMTGCWHPVYRNVEDRNPQPEHREMTFKGSGRLELDLD